MTNTVSFKREWRLLYFKYLTFQMMLNRIGRSYFIKSEYAGSYSGGYYGLDVDPVTSEVYVADAIDYVQQGVIYRYSSSSEPIDTFTVGITPGAFCFSNQ